LSLRDQSLSTVLHGEDRGSDQLVPFLLQERVNGLFTAALLGFRESLVLALFTKKKNMREKNPMESWYNRGERGYERSRQGVPSLSINPNFKVTYGSTRSALHTCYRSNLHFCLSSALYNNSGYIVVILNSQ
jgi:hypothetical protein